MLYLPIISKAITVFYLQSVWLNNGKHVFKSSIILHTYLSAWFEAKGCLLVTNFSQFFRALWCCFLDVGGSGCGSNIRLFYFPFWMVESGWIWYESKLLSVFPTQTHSYSKFYQLHAIIWNSNLSDVILPPVKRIVKVGNTQHEIAVNVTVQSYQLWQLSRDSVLMVSKISGNTAQFRQIRWSWGPLISLEWILWS